MTDQEQVTHEETASSHQSAKEQQRAGERRSASTGAQATVSPTAADPGAGADGGSQSETAGSQRAGAASEPGVADGGDERAPLFASDQAEGFRQRWESLQAGFVDQPREVVAQADDLVGELMQQLTAGFSDRRASLEAQWEEGDEVSTEDLRVALTRYRSFFNRLLSV
jgi:hypothetical protein